MIGWFTDTLYNQLPADLPGFENYQRVIDYPYGQCDTDEQCAKNPTTAGVCNLAYYPTAGLHKYIPWDDANRLMDDDKPRSVVTTVLTSLAAAVVLLTTMAALVRYLWTRLSPQRRHALRTRFRATVVPVEARVSQRKAHLGRFLA